MRMLKKIYWLPLLLLLFSFSHPGKKIKIWLIGDSTMAPKQVKAYPETGWGMPFVYFWDSTVTVDNRAMNGRSTRTFIEEKRWEPVMNEMSEGDYVFIQFGHNDEVPTKKSYVPENDFRNYLVSYISDTRKKKGIPILITPVARRSFDSAGHVVGTHNVYAQIVRDVAKENNVTLIDLDLKSQALLQQMGPEASAYLFNQLTPGEHPNYPDGVKDNTHFNELGARKMAEIVLEDIRKQEPALAERIVKQIKK
jgi:lysophospholipase L1-like esterase